MLTMTYGIFKVYEPVNYLWLPGNLFLPNTSSRIWSLVCLVFWNLKPCPLLRFAKCMDTCNKTVNCLHHSFRLHSFEGKGLCYYLVWLGSEKQQRV
jgi:hypothetical protein